MKSITEVCQIINKYAIFLDLVMFVSTVSFFKSVSYLLFLILNKYLQINFQIDFYL